MDDDSEVITEFDGLRISTNRYGGVYVDHDADRISLTPEWLRWLVLVGGPAAMHAVEGAIPRVENRANRRCPR